MNVDRRKFIKKTALAGAAISLASGFDAKAAPSNGKKVKLGFIGVGSRGRHLLTHLLAQDLTSDYEVKAICDIYQPSIERTNKVCKKYKVEVKAYKNHSKMIKEEALDGVVIATPLFEHAHITIDCLNAGIHVLCEKAMGRTLDEVKAMYDAHIKTGSILLIGHQRMFSKKYLNAMERIHKGEIGQIGQIKAYWQRNNNWRRAVPKDHPELERQINWRLYKEYSAGLLTELLSHQIQVASWAMKANPVSVMGTGSISYYKDGREVPDNVAAIFSYADGTQFIYDAMTINKNFGCEEIILGDTAIMSLETNNIKVENPPKPDPAPGIIQLVQDIKKGLFSEAPIGGASWAAETAVKYNGDPIYIGQDGDGTKEEVASFVRFIQKKSAPEWMLKDAYNGSIWTLLTEQAIDTGTKVACPGKYIVG